MRAPTTITFTFSGETNIMNTNTKSKKPGLKTIIIMAVAAVVLLSASFIIYRAVKTFLKDDEPKTLEEILAGSDGSDLIANEHNITSFKCHMFMDLTDLEIDGIKKVVTDAVGDKVLAISKGNIPLIMATKLANENGESIDAGDIVYITFSILDSEETIKVFNALIEAYGLQEKIQGNDINSIMEIKPMYRAEYDK